MPHVTGDITAFVAALDQPEDAAPVQSLIGSLGAEPVVEEFTDGPRGRERYLSFKDAGVDLLLEDGRLAAAFFHLRPAGPSASYAAYESPAALVDGLPSEPTRAAVRDLLGAPLSSSDDPAWDFYAVGPRFVNFAYEGDDLSLVTVMASDPSEPQPGEAPVAGLEVDLEAVIDAPGGDVDAFYSAFAASTDEVLAKIMLRAGPEPAMTHEKVEREGVEWLHVFLAGVDLQFKDGVLVGALIRVAREDGVNYRRADRLFDDLPLPAAREQVRAAFGTPRVSSPAQVPGESFDLYDLADGEFTAGQDLALSFDYRDDQVVSVSVLRRGVSAG